MAPRRPASADDLPPLAASSSDEMESTDDAASEELEEEEQDEDEEEEEEDEPSVESPDSSAVLENGERSGERDFLLYLKDQLGLDLEHLSRRYKSVEESKKLKFLEKWEEMRFAYMQAASLKCALMVDVISSMRDSSKSRKK